MIKSKGGLQPEMAGGGSLHHEKETERNEEVASASPHAANERVKSFAEATCKPVDKLVLSLDVESKTEAWLFLFEICSFSTPSLSFQLKPVQFHISALI